MQGAWAVNAVPDGGVNSALGILERGERKAGRIISSEIENSSNDTAAVERK